MIGKVSAQDSFKKGVVVDSQHSSLVARLAGVMKKRRTAWTAQLSNEDIAAFQRLLQNVGVLTKQEGRATHESVLRGLSDRFITKAVQSGISYKQITELIEKLEQGA